VQHYLQSTEFVKGTIQIKRDHIGS